MFAVAALPITTGVRIERHHLFGGAPFHGRERVHF
jgi:hypothetical protein